ncbi:CoA transferase [Spelaeicoccus albus]|uniref:Crotonobetainyl-CoA:carnitine CoA-transferase CaiB-like acyl-CoA transferase n=1 Tax=Spelaeicoccus albus TaxID=1280376 RepID=A0A7Z0A7W3_9MICO|nr:CoA transferase [Spelaeicoccus albus]NYI66059.1 crotonobetainyl-CoA:carnitine CoA-transferase CaiB-like acyl-CoA transferase [Spelaeicoccus albus]
MVNRILEEFEREAAARGAAPSVEFADGCVDSGPGAALPSNLPVMELASGASAAAGYAAAMLAAARNRAAPPAVRVDPLSVAAAFRCERLMQVGGAVTEPFADLSGFFRARDGWVRTHGNYPHHRRRLLAALELPSGAGRHDAEARIARLGAADIESAVRDAGGIAVAVRTEHEWRRSEEYTALAGVPMTEVRRLGHAPQRLLSHGMGAPAAGLRVLDLTRVIAGPVAGRTLAWLGAEVLRVDSPGLPELRLQHLATGAGKRSTLLDLRAPEDRCRFDHLVGEADVVLLGYRTAALTRLGLEPGELADRNPGLVIGRLSAWGDAGPRAGERGFDSIVQAASGIAWRESDGEVPGTMPAQALDHASGYLLAAGVLAAVTRQLSEGDSWRVDCRLARTAQWLLESTPQRLAETGPHWDFASRLAGVDTPSGRLEMVRPAVRVAGVPDEFTGCGREWGADPPRWARDE